MVKGNEYGFGDQFLVNEIFLPAHVLQDFVLGGDFLGLIELVLHDRDGISSILGSRLRGGLLEISEASVVMLVVLHGGLGLPARLVLGLGLCLRVKEFEVV